MFIDKDFALKIYWKAMEAANCKAVITDDIVDDIHLFIYDLINAVSIRDAMDVAEESVWIIEPVDLAFFVRYVRTYYDTEMRGRQPKDVTDQAEQKISEEMRLVLREHVKEVESQYFRTDKDVGATENCLLVWNRVRNLAGLSDLRISDLPTFCQTCRSHCVSGEDHTASSLSSK